jgi:glycosyltransferase involved in cell wall biosynthesis
MALLEAMGAGLAIIATRAGGTPELIEHERCGLLTRTGDPAELAAAISQLVRDPQRRATFAAASLQRANEQFSWLRAAQRYEAIFQDAVEQSPGKQSPGKQSTGKQSTVKRPT